MHSRIELIKAFRLLSKFFARSSSVKYNAAVERGISYFLTIYVLRSNKTEFHWLVKVPVFKCK